MLPILLATMLLTTTPTAPREEPGAVVMTTPPELPCRLGFPKLIARQVRELWAYSPTFRQQCLKIGDAGAIVAVGVSPLRIHGARAMSKIGRTEGRMIYASVILTDVRLVAEDLPHELEHVLEQIEGVDLRAGVRTGRAHWVSSAEGYETERARKAGLRARREVEQAQRPGAPAVVLASTSVQ